MSNLIKFESSKTIEKNRDDLREARSKVIQNAKDKYEKEERKKEEAKKRGEDIWMLASVNHRLNAEDEALKISKKKKKKDKHKKKKEKKKKKKKKKEASSSSDSSSDEEENAQWVEKGDKKKEENHGPLHGVVKGPKLEREGWMSAPLDLVPTLTRQDLIDKKNKEKQELEEQKRLLEQPGQHAKELNPYWKDGGTGVPEEKSETKLVTKGTGDSGLSWLRKSYQRCVEQAKEEGRSLEDLAAERWGSLEKIQSMIKEAENLAGVSHREERSDLRGNRFMRPGEGSRLDGDRPRSDSYAHNYRRSRSPSPKRHSHSSRNRSRSRERDNRKKSRSRERSRKRSRSKDRNRSRSRDRSRRNRSRSREMGSSARSGSKERNRRERSRSKERRRSRSRSKERVPSSLKGRFMKPGELSENGNRSYKSSKSGSSSATPAWKKKEFHKPVEKEEGLDRERDAAQRVKGGEEQRNRKIERRKRRNSSDSSSSESSSSESESSNSDSEAEKGERSRSKEVKVMEKVLTEKEMNALGAKILKAELMGNKEQAEKLKSQLEAAREARKNMPTGGVTAEGKNEDKEAFVVLTRTDRSGMARPVPESKHERESHSGKRRKKQKVDTHTGKEGERVRYFADDDKFDLKTLVEREKMGTAEDQNAMFSRLAGRAMKTQGDDFQVDDIFLTKANKKQAESVEEERDRAQAIMEHKQMASSMENCRFCFNKVEKHLIVAIGTKVYLSLPTTKSLTEGHCLIVPMQHVASGTTVDEDVWSEIQLFRKTLTKMFNERDEDVVFMETSMKLKYFPHMCMECVPVEKETGDMAPIYFKKAIQETGSEWSDNKKVVDISKKDIRHAVPKGFPYFSVDFGNEGGFAHVIEDEQTFPTYFGKEIIGGMIDADHSLWRKPHKENFDAQRKKVLRFSEMWKPYDWTQNLSKSTQSDSSSDSE